MNFITKQVTRMLALASLMAASHAGAASLTYVIDQSNALPDDVEYLSVTLSDDTPDRLDITVRTHASLTSIAGNNFGIQSFGFNFDDAGMPDIAKDFVLPQGWKMQPDRIMSESGRFDIRLQGTGNSRVDELSFSILGQGLDIDGIGDDFSAHVAGFQYSNFIESAFFYGSDLTAVPVPAAIWLFGAGLIAMVSIARPEKSHP